MSYDNKRKLAFDSVTGLTFSWRGFRTPSVFSCLRTKWKESETNEMKLPNCSKAFINIYSGRLISSDLFPSFPLHVPPRSTRSGRLFAGRPWHVASSNMSEEPHGPSAHVIACRFHVIFIKGGSSPAFWVGPNRFWEGA